MGFECLKGIRKKEKKIRLNVCFGLAHVCVDIYRLSVVVGPVLWIRLERLWKLPLIGMR